MANVLLLGATGRFGAVLSKKLQVETDHNLTLFSRHAMECSVLNDRTVRHEGSATSILELSEAMEGQDIVYCAISGSKLPEIANNIIAAMSSCDVKRLIFMGAVGIYDELPEELKGKSNLLSENSHMPNSRAVDIIEESDVDFTIIRPGLLRAGDENDFEITKKGAKVSGYISSIESVANLAVEIINNPDEYIGEDLAITRKMI